MSDRRLLLPLVPAVLLLASCGSSGRSCTLNDPPQVTTLHHDEPTSVGYYNGIPSPEGPFELAVRLDSSLTGPVACGSLRAVRFWWGPIAPAALSIRIYGDGTAARPGALLTELAIPPASLTLFDWNEVNLLSPPVVAEGDLWVSARITATAPGNGSLGMDNGPGIAGANYYFDGTWQEPGLSGNWTLQAIVWK